MNKKLLTVVLVLGVFMVSAFASSTMMANSKQTASAETNAVKHVAIVFSTGGLGDKSFNDAAFAGAQKANDTSKVSIVYAEPKTVGDINTYIENYAQAGTYDLIIAIGFSSADGVNASSIAHPNQNFAIIDDNSINRSNVADITFKEQEGSFLVGAMAAMTSNTSTIGFLGGLNIPLINKFRSGYEQGAYYINPNIKVISQYSPDANNPWGDVAGGKQVANTEISQGADVIYAAAGGTGLGVFDAANESRAAGNLVYAIGVDSNQDYIQPGIVLTSMVKRVDTAVYNLIEATIDGSLNTNYLGKWQQLGLAQNGVSMTDMSYTSWVNNSICTGTTTRGQVVDNLKKDIIDGKITVNPLLMSTASLKGNFTVSHACTNPAPAPPTSTSSAPGFEYSAVFGLLLAVPIIRKKMKKN